MRAERRRRQPAVRRLAWRDFFLHPLAEDPALAWRNLRDADGDLRAQVPEDRAPGRLARVGPGSSIDAGMRQLLRGGCTTGRDSWSPRS